MRAGLIALDERPVNTRYPSMIADIAGVDLVQPPPAILSSRRQPADCNQLLAWLEQAAAGLDTLIVSLVWLSFSVHDAYLRNIYYRNSKVYLAVIHHATGE